MFSDGQAEIVTVKSDEVFLDSLVASADIKSALLLEGGPRLSTEYFPHRLLASRVKLLVSCYLANRSNYYQSSEIFELAGRIVDQLAMQQGASGLFVGGDNVNSPPDSAFSLNDLADADALLAQMVPATRQVTGLRARLKEIADAAKPALLTGGVHTPNHRWEISAALARFHRSWPDLALRARAEEWLAEGIDIDSDGFYSERSPNYAAYVSNPALLLIGDVFNLPQLHDLVERNLSLTLDLIRPDGSVETIQSRRQDQNGPYPLAPYLMPYRRFAIERKRSDFAWAATLASRDGIVDPETLLAETLLHPQIAEVMPEPVALAGERSSLASGVSLASDISSVRTLVAYGGSDYQAFRSIRSGLANNPTFARLFAGQAVLDSIRLSRDFFGLGPFRAGSFELLENTGIHNQYRLTETIGACYFQPIRAESRSPEGTYVLSDDGRFSASMAFDERDTDTVTLTTTIVVQPTVLGANLQFTFDGPDVGWALELTFRPGGVLDGLEPINETDAHLVSGMGQFRMGSDAIRFGPGNGDSLDTPPIYRPGQDYSFLRGTDATNGQHVYITGRSPGTYVLCLEAVRVDPS